MIDFLIGMDAGFCEKGAEVELKQRNLHHPWPQRSEWLRRWSSLLGDPGYSLDGVRSAGLADAEKIGEAVCKAPADGFEVHSYRLAVGPQELQKVLLLRPIGEVAQKRARDGKLPCAVVPFYEPETSAGLELDSDHRGLSRVAVETEELKLRQYGIDLVRQGYLVICTEAYPFNMVPPTDGDKFLRWQAAADCLKERYPSWTGLGKLVHDTRCAVTLLLQQPDADSHRLAIMGHSLGGKIAFYTGCLDERIGAIVASDFGLPWNSTNWNDPWYLGERCPSDESDLTHDKLLALLSPGAFFLIAGETDNDASWQIVERARSFFPSTPDEQLAWFHHATGHSPTAESLTAAYRWLERQMG